MTEQNIVKNAGKHTEESKKCKKGRSRSSLFLDGERHCVCVKATDHIQHTLGARHAGTALAAEIAHERGVDVLYKLPSHVVVALFEVLLVRTLVRLDQTRKKKTNKSIN